MTLFLTITATLGIGYYIGKLHGRRIERRYHTNFRQESRRLPDQHKKKVEKLRTISIN